MYFRIVHFLLDSKQNCKLQQQQTFLHCASHGLFLFRSTFVVWRSTFAVYRSTSENGTNRIQTRTGMLNHRSILTIQFNWLNHFELPRFGDHTNDSRVIHVVVFINSSQTHHYTSGTIRFGMCCVQLQLSNCNGILALFQVSGRINNAV